MLVELDIVDEGRPAVEREIEGVVEIVVEICSRGYDPIHESVLNQGYDAGPAQSRGRQRPRQAHADGDILSEHLLREELAGLAKTSGVVGLEIAINKPVNRYVFGDRSRDNRCSVQMNFR